MLLEKAKKWERSFETPLFANSEGRKSFQPFIRAIIRMHQLVPLSVRLTILFTGKIPVAYIEGDNNDRIE